jgi:hypothetical protein
VADVESELLHKLGSKSLTKAELLQKVRENPDLLPEVLSGVSSSKAAIRYGCAKVLMDLSLEQPERLYPYMDSFLALLDSKYRILVWNSMAMIANLAKVDRDRKFDATFNKYYRFLNDEHMVTVANVVGNSGKIALAKPYLVQRITSELLKVENVSTTPHLTDECKRVITEKTIESFDMFFDRIEAKDKVISFVKRNQNSSRRSLKIKAESFLKKWAAQ